MSDNACRIQIECNHCDQVRAITACSRPEEEHEHVVRHIFATCGRCPEKPS